MPATVIVGLQWGDEGKAKVLDALAPKTDMVVRYQGGANAGHTVVVGDERYAFHLVPSGILHEGKICVIAGGCVVDPLGLVEEIGKLRERGLSIGGSNLILSERAHLVMPYHKLLDRLSESRKEKTESGKIGTTGRGIGPAYVDKASRSGLRAIDLLDAEYFRARVRDRLLEINRMLPILYDEKPLSPDAVADEILATVDFLKPLLNDTGRIINQALAEGRNVLFEGAQGAMLDVDHGTYPFVTSSSTTAGGAATGSGVPPQRLTDILGIAKAYATRVGAGPFPTELKDEVGERLRKRGNEFGTTTGRPRRCGWFDAAAVSYALEVTGANGIALTKLDVLSGEKDLFICTGYKLNGRVLDRPPTAWKECETVEPVGETLPGWSESLSAVQSFSDLPDAARRYVERLEALAKVPIRYVGVGPTRTALIQR